MMRRIAVIVAAVCCGASSACATLDQMAVGQTARLRSAPHYLTVLQAQGAQPVLAMPVEPDPVSTDPFHLAGREAALRPLLDAINKALMAHPCCSPIDLTALPGRAPILFVGSLDGEHAPVATGIEQMEHEEYAPMILHLEKPDAAWRSAVATAVAAQGGGRILLVRLGFSQYPKADRGVFGKKVVLGTNHEQPVRFLSAIDRSIEVVQLTGILLDAEGRVLRAGAEGIAGYDTPFLAQTMEMDRDVLPEAIERLVNDERREDLPGRPLKWQAALDQLLHQLLR